MSNGEKPPASGLLVPALKDGAKPVEDPQPAIWKESEELAAGRAESQEVIVACEV
jgi:hypothetical protein